MRIKPPKIIRKLFPTFIWNFPDEKDGIFLTFDDGPRPEVTPWVLDLLDKYNAKATFFCIGNNVNKYKETFELIKKEGHSVGNHTFNHERGWKTKTKDYINSVKEADTLIKSPLFRPPHGRIKFSQIISLKKKFRISATQSLKFIAWTVISYDWDKSLTPDDCFNNVIKNAGDGSIIVFHDSEKAVDNMIPALTKVLEYYTERGFAFEKLGMKNTH
jgi:peptidoglycan/xylan/chitin deacetylase (PgdA/CDA1 family)